MSRRGPKLRAEAPASVAVMVRLSPAEAARLDAARGDVPRAAWLYRLVVAGSAAELRADEKEAHFNRGWRASEEEYAKRLVAVSTTTAHQEVEP